MVLMVSLLRQRTTLLQTSKWLPLKKLPRPLSIEFILRELLENSEFKGY